MARMGGGGGLERGLGRELYRHYVTASSRAVPSGRGLGLLPVHGELWDCQGGGPKIWDYIIYIGYH